jgi:hypothetical protein
MKNYTQHCAVATLDHRHTRRGSTLIIVIALLGILALLGLVFFTFASQERSAAENFAEAAKATETAPVNVWDHMLRQLIVGADESEKGSILYSPTDRHSLVRNLVGSDIYPMTGAGVSVSYGSDGGGNLAVPIADPTIANPTPDWLDFVDSPAARDGAVERVTPEPDVDYTYPDINNLFLAYRGWAIREEGAGYTQVPVIIPSFFRPQYMKTSDDNRTDNGVDRSVVTDPFWAYADDGAGNPVAITVANRNTVDFEQRSFRPHPLHLAGKLDDGTPTFRYLTDGEASTFSVAHGGCWCNGS